MSTYNHKNTALNHLHGLENNDCSNDYILNYNTVHLAYNIDKITGDTLNDKQEEYLSKLDGWQQVCHSRISDEISAYNLRAAVFVNKSKNALHFAFAGTDPSNYNDLLDDFYIYCHKIVNKFNPMQSLVNKVDEVIGEDKATNYSISSSGHSLGAVLSDLLAAEMLSRGRKFAKSTTFDSPGSKPIVKEAIQNNLLTCSKELCLNDVAKHCKAFFVRPNFINSSNPQLADEKRLVVPNKSEKNEHEDGKLGWTSFLYDMLGTACNTAADFLGINHVISQVNEHKLANFTDYEKRAVKVSDWIEYNKKTGHYNPTPIISEEDNPGLALNLQDAQPSSKDALFVSEEADCIHAQWVSSNQLVEAQNIQLSQENTEDEDEWVDAEDWVDTEDWVDAADEGKLVDVKSDDGGYDSGDESDFFPQLVEAQNMQSSQERTEDEDDWVYLNSYDGDGYYSGDENGHQEHINHEVSGQYSEVDVNI